MHENPTHVLLAESQIPANRSLRLPDAKSVDDAARKACKEQQHPIPNRCRPEHLCGNDVRLFDIANSTSCLMRRVLFWRLSHAQSMKITTLRFSPLREAIRMIIDVHSHAWAYPQHFTDDFRQQARRAAAGVEVDLSVRFEDYQRTASEPVRTIVFGGKARFSGLWVDDRYVADYVAAHPDRLLGFLSLDPTQPGWEDEMRFGHQELKLRGIKLMPMYAGFRPDEPRLDALWGYAERHHLPVLLHTGTTFISQAPLGIHAPAPPRRASPTRFPDLPIIMAHLGHPYEGECVVTARKHPHVYADISALHYRPWQLYNSLMLVQEYGVWDKILFGTDYPFTTVDATLAGLRTLNHMLAGTSLPRLNEAAIERLIYRDSLTLLGLACIRATLTSTSAGPASGN